VVVHDAAVAPAGREVRRVVAGAVRRAADDQSKIGPQVDGGQLQGEFTNEGQIVLNLNPTMADNNVRLIGKIDRAGGNDSGHMTGAWTYSNFTGMANHGLFEAKTPALTDGCRPVILPL
jgi:hypothetical protein